jgi:quinoprotein glucose dehydrogenase
VAAEAACADRVFLGTNDARLIALDLATGKPRAGFGSNGEITLPPDVPPLYRGELHIDSAPTLVNDVVVVGSAVDDMSRLERRAAPSSPSTPAPGRSAGASIRCRVGRTILPRLPGRTAAMSDRPAAVGAYVRRPGARSDLPGNRRPNCRLLRRRATTSSVVALRASTGQVVWHFQTTHHDVWDYNLIFNAGGCSALAG